VATPQLTLKQFAILALGQSTPPWHLGDLLKCYKQYRMSLRQSVAALSGATTVIFAALSSYDFEDLLISWVANESGPSEIPGVTDAEQAAEWDNDWAVWASHFSDFTQTLYNNPPDHVVKLANILAPIGGSIAYLNEYYTTVGIAATFGALANLNTAVIPGTPPSSFLNIFTTGVSDPSVFTDAVSGAVIVGPIAGQSGGTVVLSSTPYTPFPPAMAGNVPMGLLYIYVNNQENNTAVVADIDAKQLAAQHLQMSRDLIGNLLRDLICGQASVGILGALGNAMEDLTAYLAWLNHLATVTVTNPLPAGTNLSLGFSGNFTIPQITLQPAGQPPITISEATVEPDGSVTGGTVSQGFVVGPTQGFIDEAI
jgi:hypothetical protein